MKIKLTGISAEVLKAESLEYSDVRNIKTLLKVIKENSKILESAKLYVTINDEIASESQSFEKTDKIFVLNPFSGG